MSETFYTSGQVRTTISLIFISYARINSSTQESQKMVENPQKTREVVGLICCQQESEVRPPGMSRTAKAAGNERTERDDFIKSGRLV